MSSIVEYQNGFFWDVICVAARLPAHAEAYKQELRHRQSYGFIAPSSLLLSVGDPGDFGAEDQRSLRIGSGGASLNALLLVAEHLSALAGENNIDMGILRNRRILILQMGGAMQRTPAFSLLPFCASGKGDGSNFHALSTVDLLLQGIAELARECPPGLFIVSSEDSFANVGPSLRAKFARAANGSDCTKTDGIVAAMATAVPLSESRRHGVYALDDTGGVRRVLYHASPEDLKDASPNNGGCDLAKICGVVFFNTVAAEKMLHLAFHPLFEACSFIGIDNGARPNGFSLYLDLLASLGSDVSLEEFTARRLGQTCSVKAALQEVCSVRDMGEQLWRQLHGHITLNAVVVKPEMATYLHVRSPADYIKLISSLTGTHTPISQIGIRSVTDNLGSVNTAFHMVNSVVADSQVKRRSVVENCDLRHCSIGEQAVCSGLRAGSYLKIPNNICLQQVALVGGGFCAVTFTMKDLATFEEPEGTFLDVRWLVLLEELDIKSADLWIADEPHTLTTARLFPVVPDLSAGSLGLLWLEYAQKQASESKCTIDWLQTWVKTWAAAKRVSIAEVTTCADIAAEFAWQREVAAKSNTLQVRDALLARRNVSIAPIIADEVKRGSWGLLRVLDDIAADLATAPDIAARALSQIAEVLASFAGAEGGLRSGNARHPQWFSAIETLGDVSKPSSRKDAVLAMRRLRQQWINDGPVALVRMARHYEAAAQMLIRMAVDTATQFLTIIKTQPRPVGDCVCIEAPARIDIAGGWTDTPPICYEHGGAVTNLALKVDGKRPIGARAKRIPAFELIFEIADSSESASASTARPPVVCRELSDLQDYNRPAAPGALLKAAVLCCGAVDLSGPPLAEQLETFGGGLHVTSWSNLPQGSGLGTSSILAGVVMNAISIALGRQLDQQSLIHAVLKVEQMLTTGGGWQDQVGGLLGGAKIARSEPSLPLHVVSEQILLTESVSQAISDRLVLVFTGRPRLAKSLLQNVLRRWYARLPEICEVVNQLTANAEEAVDAIRTGNLEKLGQCLSAYWEHKKLMAAGCEPQAVATLRERLAPHSLGFSLAGAGGGGFAVVLMREPHSGDCVREALVGIDGLEGATIHKAEVDPRGILEL